ncbi:hypothetical protein J6590_015016 [Homalodisca vitripennis]|nr:hypothetical protein J6590_015016 [Homalodisca vitripennis]
MGASSSVRAKATMSIWTHYTIHREALATEHVIKELRNILNIGMGAINYIKRTWDLTYHFLFYGSSCGLSPVGRMFHHRPRSEKAALAGLPAVGYHRQTTVLDKGSSLLFIDNLQFSVDLVSDRCDVVISENLKGRPIMRHSILPILAVLAFFVGSCVSFPRPEAEARPSPSPKPLLDNLLYSLLTPLLPLLCELLSLVDGVVGLLDTVLELLPELLGSGQVPYDTVSTLFPAV